MSKHEIVEVQYHDKLKSIHKIGHMSKALQFHCLNWLARHIDVFIINNIHYMRRWTQQFNCQINCMKEGSIMPLNGSQQSQNSNMCLWRILSQATSDPWPHIRKEDKITRNNWRKKKKKKTHIFLVAVIGLLDNNLHMLIYINGMGNNRLNVFKNAMRTLSFWGALVHKHFFFFLIYDLIKLTGMQVNSDSLYHHHLTFFVRFCF